MRLRMGIVVWFLTLGVVAAPVAWSDDAPSAVAKKAAPSDQQIADVVGERMSKVFAKLGYPDDLFASDVSSDSPSVFVDYGPYGFKVRKKVVQCAMFFSDWKGTVFGAKMGDGATDVVKKLGTPKTSDKGGDGLPYMIWSFKQWDGTLELDFDKDNKLKRAVVSVD